MIEAGTILVGAGYLALVLVAGLLARRPAHVPVTVRKRKRQSPVVRPTTTDVPVMVFGSHRT